MRSVPRRRETSREQIEDAAGGPDGQERDRSTPPPRERQQARRRPSVRWRASVRVHWRLLVAGALLASGIVFVILGWYGAAYTNVITEQIPYLISGGLLGLGLIILSGILAYSALTERSLLDLRRALVEALREREPGGEPAGVAVRRVDFTRGATEPANGSVFVVPGGRSYHEPGCPIVEGKEGARALTPAKAAGAGYVACKLCGPD